MPDENKSLSLSEEQEQEVMMRSFRVVDYVSEVAINIIMDFVHNVTCPEAKQMLLNSPEVIAIRAFERALSDLVGETSAPEGPVH